MSNTDRAFDGLVAAELRHLSEVHWTPVAVAVRAASLLTPGPRTRVLDVGSGVGKLCAVGALSSAATWYGVEQHGELVHAACMLSRCLGVGDRTVFLHGDVFAIEWCDFDALYLYNPFEQPLFPRALTAQEHSTAYRVQVARMEDRLATLRPGTRVLTLHGFGGVMPATYDLVYHECVPGVGLDLALWVQRSTHRPAARRS